MHIKFLATESTNKPLKLEKSWAPMGFELNKKLLVLSGTLFNAIK